MAIHALISGVSRENSRTDHALTARSLARSLLPKYCRKYQEGFDCADESTLNKPLRHEYDHALYSIGTGERTFDNEKVTIFTDFRQRRKNQEAVGRVTVPPITSLHTNSVLSAQHSVSTAFPLRYPQKEAAWNQISQQHVQ